MGSRPTNFQDGSLMRAGGGEEPVCGWRQSSCLPSWYEMSRSNGSLSVRGSMLCDLQAVCVGVQETLSKSPGGVLTADLQCLRACSLGWTPSGPLAGLLTCCGERKGGFCLERHPCGSPGSPQQEFDAEQHQQTVNRHFGSPFSLCWRSLLDCLPAKG